MAQSWVQSLVVGSQVQGSQIFEIGSEQLPLPSQVRMPVTPSPSQVPALHGVSFSNLRQPPLPSQVPSSPQVAGELATHWRATLGLTPDGTGAQTPKELGRSQALQVSVQASLQQIPSTQNPVWHSRSQLQDWAFPLDWLGISGGQVLGWATSEALPSRPPPPSGLAKLAPLQPAAAKTAHRAKPIQKVAPAPCDDVDF